VEKVVEFLKDEKVNIQEEVLVVNFVTSYIKHRDNVKPLLDEEDPANDSQVIA
jgi:hypothetical protein